ncbi:hypothetical protein AB6A40_005806 [Gnathostoma spinigerum]|uniref:Uncharacterized protein n=1 Tax=Gnathostoma spinigerum TaxID=75299 RepID=A0ABD6EQY3_9BILA
MIVVGVQGQIHAALVAIENVEVLPEKCVLLQVWIEPLEMSQVRRKVGCISMSVFVSSRFVQLMFHLLPITFAISP